MVMRAYRGLLAMLVVFGVSCTTDVDRELAIDDQVAWVAPYASGGVPAATARRDRPAYISYDQDAVLLDGVDFADTIEVATRAAARGGTTSLMVLWAVRDQAIDAASAARAGALYLANIDAIYSAPSTFVFDWNFGVWHSSWAISNLYRNGSPQVRAALQEAYDDAITRPATLERFRDVANTHVNGARPLMGDIHIGGRTLARRTLVVPGNPDYLQSADDYE
jgi:hypothetical protein